MSKAKSNTLKSAVEEAKKSSTKEAKESGGSSITDAPKQVGRSIMDVISGNIFRRDEVVKHLPFVLFGAFLTLLYIANGYLAEDTIRQLNRTDSEIKELRSQYISIKAELNNKIIQSELSKIIDEKGIGLKESVTPPRKIVYNEETLKRSE